MGQPARRGIPTYPATVPHSRGLADTYLPPLRLTHLYPTPLLNEIQRACDDEKPPSWRWHESLLHEPGPRFQVLFALDEQSGDTRTTRSPSHEDTRAR